MAYRHTLSVRAAIMAQKCHPSVCHILHDKDDHKYHSPDENFSLPFLQRRFFGSSLDKPIANGSGRYRERIFSDALCRHMSTEISVLGFPSCLEEHKKTYVVLWPMEKEGTILSI